MSLTTDNETYMTAYAGDAQRSAELLADELVRVAEDIKVYAQNFEATLAADSRQTPSSLASSIVSKFTHGTGSYSARLGSVVYNAGKAEAYLALFRAQDIAS